MQNFGNLIQQLDRMVERLKTTRRDREARVRQALRLLSDVEERTRNQQAALDRALARVAALEAERDALLARVSEIVDLYDSSMAESETLLRRVESMAERVSSGTGTSSSPAQPIGVPEEGGWAESLPASDSSAPGSEAQSAAQLQERFTDHEAMRRLYNQFHRSRAQGGDVV